MAGLTRRGVLGATAALGLAACGPKENAGSGANQNPEDLSGEVTMWHPPVGGDKDRAYWDESAKRFMATHPNVKVSVEIIPWQSRGERMQTAIRGRSTPDVTYALPSDVYSWGNGGLLADAAEILGAEKENFLTNALETMSYQGTLYAVPMLTGMSTTLYVKSVWDKLGYSEADYPGTWDEVRTLAPELKAKGIYITQYDAAPTMTLNGSFYPLLWSAGGRVLSEDLQTVTVNEEPGVKALEFVKWLVDGGHTPADALTQELPVESSPIAQEKVAMLFARSVASLTQNGLEADNIVVGKPLTDVETLSYGNVGGYVSFKASKNPDATAAWIRFMTSPEEMKSYLPERFQHSPRKDVTDLYPEGSQDAKLAEYLQYGMVEPASPNATEIMNKLKPHLQSALLGKSQPKAALDAAAAEIEQVIKKS